MSHDNLLPASSHHDEMDSCAEQCSFLQLLESCSADIMMIEVDDVRPKDDCENAPITEEHSIESKEEEYEDVKEFDLEYMDISLVSEPYEVRYVDNEARKLENPRPYHSEVPKLRQWALQPSGNLRRHEQPAGTSTVFVDDRGARGRQIAEVMRRSSRIVSRPRTSNSGRFGMQLSEMSRQAMLCWYNAHRHHAYPTQTEKEYLARIGGITVSQVNSWFCNHRNRSDNTYPKKTQRLLNARLRAFALQLESSSGGLLSAQRVASNLIDIFDYNSKRY